MSLMLFNDDSMAVSEKVQVYFISLKGFFNSAQNIFRFQLNVVLNTKQTKQNKKR